MSLFDQFAVIAENYMTGLDNRPVYPSEENIRQLNQLIEPLQDEPVPAEEVLNILNDKGPPATVTSTGGRYYGFVCGSALPAAMVAKLLANVWDQNAGMYVMSPIAALLEEISSTWMIDLLGLSKQTSVGFVTGATMGNFTALAAARHALLKNEGWDVE